MRWFFSVKLSAKLHRHLSAVKIFSVLCRYFIITFSVWLVSSPSLKITLSYVPIFINYYYWMEIDEASHSLNWSKLCINSFDLKTPLKLCSTNCLKFWHGHHVRFMLVRFWYIGFRVAGTYLKFNFYLVGLQNLK